MACSVVLSAKSNTQQFNSEKMIDASHDWKTPKQHLNLRFIKQMLKLIQDASSIEEQLDPMKSYFEYLLDNVRIMGVKSSRLQSGSATCQEVVGVY